MAETDGTLVARMVGGDEGALGALYDRHGPTMFALAARILGNRDDAEEVVMEAFVQAWRNASRYAAERASVAGWLVMLVRSRALDRLRARRRREAVLRRAVAAAPEGDAPAMSQPPSQAADVTEAAERRIQVLAVLDELPEAQRVCIRLAYYDGLTQTEIAARLAEPLGTVKTRMRLGMMKLRDRLQPLMAERYA